MNHRIEWIDYAKSIAIFIVVLLHTQCDFGLIKMARGFIIPLFFIISGYLFSYKRNPSIKNFYRKRFRQIFVPYLWLSLLTYIFWLTVLRHYGHDAANPVDWHLPLKGIIAGIGPLMLHDIPLWSLFSFFIVEIIAYPLGLIIRRPLLIAAMAFTISFLSTLFCAGTIATWPLVAGPSLAGLGFYSIGHWCRTMADKPLAQKIKLISPQSAIIALIVFLLSYSNNSQVIFYICDFGNYILFITSSISGSIVVINISAWMARCFGETGFIRFISTGTLLICGLHLMAFALLKGLCLFVIGIDPDTVTHGILRGCIFASVAFILTLPAVYIIQRYMPFLIKKT